MHPLRCRGRDGMRKRSVTFLLASPSLAKNTVSAKHTLGNRAKSAVAHGDRVSSWIGNLTRFQEEITVYNKPASAGGGYASRAEINRNSVVSAVDRALTLAREHADRAGKLALSRQLSMTPECLLLMAQDLMEAPVALSGAGYHGMAAGNVADGQTGTDGPLPYCPPAAGSGEARRVGEPEVIAC